MSKRVVKQQNMLFGRTSPQHRRLLELLGPSHSGRYSVADRFRWFLEESLRRAGNPMTQDAPRPPEPARQQTQDAVETYLACVQEQHPLEDILGPLYMEIGRGNSALGQFFTPEPIARMMATMTLGEDPEHRGEMLRVCDPCCGSGVMMLAFGAAVLEQYGPKSLGWVSLTGVDLDPICARMFALQALTNAAIHGLTFGELFVAEGNSLFPEQHWHPLLFATRPGIEVEKDVPHPHHPARKAAIRQAAAGHPDLFPWYTGAA